MFNTESLTLFVLIFSTLVISRATIKVMSALLQNPPVRYETSSRELLLIGLSFSYLLTYYLKIIL